MSKHILLLLLILSVSLFVLGLYYPILSTKQQVLGVVLKYKNVRLFDSVKSFYESKDYLLAIIIFIFTVILPIIKYIDLFNKILTIFKPSKKMSDFLHLLDKWSMLDVFLVALLLLNFKMDSNIIVMKLKMGTNFIALSILVRMLTTILINNKFRKHISNNIFKPNKYIVLSLRFFLK